ncbi:MAG TPA: amidohydrolase family protein [Acidobacteriota bacterium]
MRICDAHGHFFSARFFRLLMDRPDSTAPLEPLLAASGIEPPPEDPVELAARWDAQLAAHDVARMALMASHPGDLESVAQALRAYPRRFVGFAMIDPRDPAAAARAADLGFRALALFPALLGFDPAGPEADAALAVARDRGLAAFVHAGMLKIPLRDKLGLKTPLDGRYLDPLCWLAAARRYPEVPFIVPHLGSGYLREALMLAELCPNVRLDTAGAGGWRKVLHPPLSLSEAFARALEVAGPDRLLFGSDSGSWPRGYRKDILEAQHHAFWDIGVDAGVIDGIFGGNFERLFPG